MKTQIINLKGGAKLLFNRQTEINGICLEFTFKAGSLNDPMGKLGVAHFCEHALCDFANAKMTKKERSSYSRKFQYRNAYTSNSNMGFSIRTVDEDFEDAVDFAEKNGLPIIIRPAYTLGGTGGGIAETMTELKEIAASGIKASRVGQILVEKSVAGYKEIEFEVMRDKSGHAIIVCDMENVDPVGIHTGDSVVVAPCQT